MKRSAAAPFICALLVTSASFATAAPFNVLEGEDEYEFNYDEGSEIGPADWGNLKPEWAACGDGLRQSPIDLEDEHVVFEPSLGRLQLDYRRSQATLRNKGHDIQMEWPNTAGNLTLGGINYSLLQLHWHTPSEHAINGQRYDLEMHMVHQSASGDYAVVGVLFQYGRRPDHLLTTLRRPLHWMAYDTRIEEVRLRGRWPWNLNRLKGYHIYNGSLTTPPCTESVTWIVMNKIMPVRWNQVNWLKSAVHEGFENNARPLQQLNGRKIYKYRTCEFEPDAAY